MPKPLTDKPLKRAKPTKAKLEGWLKAHGHRAADVDAMTAAADSTLALRTLHGITDAEWQAAR